MFLKFRYFERLLLAFFKKFKGVLLVGILLGIIMFVVINLILPRLTKPRPQIFGIIGRYHTDEIPNDITTLIGSGLTKINENLELEPSLAKSWESPDKGKTWIFHLDEKYHWQDGTPVVSDDINYELSNVSLSKPDANTIIFQLNEAYTPFPVVVSRPVFKKGLLGTGEWQVKKISLQGSYIQYLVLENEKSQSREYKFYPTEDVAKTALKLGEIKILPNVYNPEPFTSWSNMKIEKSTLENQIITIFFNTQDSELSDKSLRQALNYAIDKSKYGLERAIGPISANSWAYNPQLKLYDLDIKKAKETVDTLEKNQGKPVTVSLVTSPLLLTLSEQIANDWRAIGVDTTVSVSSTIPSDFQAFLTIFDVPYDPDQYTIWHSTQQSTNVSNYVSPRIDKLLEDGRIELNLEKRKQIYFDFQRFLVEDNPAIFLFHPNVYTIKRI